MAKMHYKSTEYQVSAVDNYGDFVDCEKHDTLAEARAQFTAWQSRVGESDAHSTICGVALEKVVSKYYTDDAIPMVDYTTIEEFGDCEGEE